jgi:hypothetical protein
MEILMQVLPLLLVVAVLLGIGVALSRLVPRIPLSGWAAVALQLPLLGLNLSMHIRYG